MKKTLLIIPLFLGITACSQTPNHVSSSIKEYSESTKVNVPDTHSVYEVSLYKDKEHFAQVNLMLLNDTKQNLNLNRNYGYLSLVTRSSKTCNPKLVTIKKTKTECIQDISPSQNVDGYHGYIIKHDDNLTIHLEKYINNYTFDKTFNLPVADHIQKQFDLDGSSLIVTRH